MTEKKEDYYVMGSFIFESFSYQDVPCKVYLPKTIYDKPKIVIRSSSRSTRSIGSHWKLSFEANIPGYSKGVNTKIKCPEIYANSSKTRCWGPSLEETTISYSAENLEVITHQGKGNILKTSIEFWITLNSYITPQSMASLSYDGNVEVKVTKNLSFDVNGIIFDFVNRYKYEKNSSDDTIQSKYLVGTCECELYTIDTEFIISNYLNKLDDFLLLTSFASRHRTACVGWDKYDSESHAKFYRGNYSIPTKKKNDTYDGLIDISDFDCFIGLAIDNFEKYEDKEVLRSAILSLLPLTQSSVEKSFLSKFAALESLILIYKRNENVEFILTENEWKILRKQLEKSIKNCSDLTLTPEKRASIYSKLSELNRLSLKESFEKFQGHYNLFYKDLWPIFGTSEFGGLSDIRNILIHGEPLPRGLFNALVSANAHLHIYIERALVVILGWNVEKTDIGISQLSVSPRGEEDFHRNSKDIKLFMSKNKK